MKTFDVILAKKFLEENKDNEKIILIDVRTSFEFNQGHIKGAKLKPIEEIEEWIEFLEKDKTYILYCRTSNRSKIAHQILESKNIEVISILGGILDWNNNNYPLEK